MRIDTVRDTLRVRIGPTFEALDVELIQSSVVALGPLSGLAIDFADVRRCDDAALAHLARVVTSLGDKDVTLRGLTIHQSRLLESLGVDRRQLRSCRFRPRYSRSQAPGQRTPDPE
jgi:anti-anti-sigma regulatory factor